LLDDGVEDEDEDEGSGMLFWYLCKLRGAVKDGRLGLVLAHQAQQAHLGVLADMLRCGPGTAAFEAAAWCVWHVPFVWPDKLQVLAACGQPLLAALPRVENSSGCPACTLQRLLTPHCPADRTAEEADVLCATFVDAVGLDAVVSLVQALDTDAMFSYCARAPALRIACALAASDEDVLAEVLQAGLPRVLVRALRENVALASLLRRLAETCAPLAEAVFEAGAARALTSCSD
jgi:hypothetical protein